MRVYLIGYMYSGKSTLGRQLAQRLGWQFVDLDSLFESRYRTTVSLFFRRYGEAAFRRLETLLLLDTERLDRVVVSTGGGLPCHGGNMDTLLRLGHTVYLRASMDELLARMASSRKPRPLFQGLGFEERRALMEAQLREREPHYLRAHLVFDGTDAAALETALRRTGLV